MKGRREREREIVYHLSWSSKVSQSIYLFELEMIFVVFIWYSFLINHFLIAQQLSSKKKGKSFELKFSFS